MHHHFLAAGGLAFVLALGSPGAAQAFDLDPRYVDNDGDLIADIPENASEWVDPATLIFAYTPVEDPAVYAEVWADFLEHMEAVTGKPVQFFPIQSNAAQIEAMRAGRLHVAAFATGPTPLAVACAGYRPFTMMAAADGSYGYEMEIITYPGSGIESIEDLEGRTMAFTSETSNSGFKAPAALLDAEFGLEPGIDFETAFSGAHDNSILGVANKDYDAAAIANTVKLRMIDRNVVNADDFVILYTSDTFPTSSYGVVHNLHPDLQEKVEEAFFSYDWEGTKLQEEFMRAGWEQFIPITFQEDWSVVRQIDDAMGVAYTCN